MEPISNTVRERLAAQQNPAEHPDADLLTAYAENTLAARERDGVTTHLARCRACRDAVLLAAPEIPALAQSFPQRASMWSMRPVGRWVVAGAAVMVVGAAVLLNHFDTLSRQQLATVQEPPKVEQPAASTQAAPATAAEQKPGVPGVGANINGIVPQQNEVAAKPESIGKLKKSTSPQLSARSDGARGSAVTAQRAKAGQPVIAPPDLLVHAYINANNSPVPPPPPLHDVHVKTEADRVTLAQIPATSANQVGVVGGLGTARMAAKNAAAGTPQSASPSIAAMKAEVPAGAAVRPAISAENAGMAGVQTEAAGGTAWRAQMANFGRMPSAACTLIADGVRCVQNNHKVEMHQPGANLKVIVSLGSLVWAGGDALLRSEDGGATWKGVKKPSQDVVLKISLLPDGVYVGGLSGALWKTTDNGATWMQTSATK